MVKDDLGRTFGSLRVSLTDLCNLACTYCTSDNSKLSLKEISEHAKGQKYLAQVAALHEICNFKEIRLTGGEPLLFRGIENLVEAFVKMGIPKIKLTTNGTMLAKKAKLLKDAGLDTVNVSLDVLNEELFHKMSKRRNINKVLDGIDAAVEAGLSPKINTVVMKGINTTEIVPLFNYFRERKIRIRFLEFMQMGELRHEYDRYFVPQAEILKQISSVAKFTAVERPNSATANYWETEDGYQFGIIANTSRPFCHDCDRLRIGNDGKIYGCLSNPEGLTFDPSENNKEQTIALLERTLAMKQRLEFKGSELSMKFIGG